MRAIFITGTLKPEIEICSATKNDQNAKNVSIITVCHMDRSTFFADVVKASFEEKMSTLLRRATRSSSVVGFAGGYFLRLVILY